LRRQYRGDAANLCDITLNNEIDDEDLTQLLYFGYSICKLEAEKKKFQSLDESKKKEALNKCRKNWKDYAEWFESLLTVVRIMLKDDE
jgi:hypothetical protein